MNLTQYDTLSGFTPAGSNTSFSVVPFLVKVNISDLNIRIRVGINYDKIGKHTGKCVFTITEVKFSTGPALGWGKLKSGTSWDCTRSLREGITE